MLLLWGTIFSLKYGRIYFKLTSSLKYYNNNIIKFLINDDINNDIINDDISDNVKEVCRDH